MLPPHPRSFSRTSVTTATGQLQLLWGCCTMHAVSVMESRCCVFLLLLCQCCSVAHLDRHSCSKLCACQALAMRVVWRQALMYGMQNHPASAAAAVVLVHHACCLSPEVLLMHDLLPLCQC